MPNELARETSPYLLQHAHNPVEWVAWGTRAFERARAEDKPLFLSVGYSTCHWCHVMERESFENEVVAEVMNRHFINVKVDREERPDVDATYMAFVQAATGHGGWPMSVWLTPDGRPLAGGTYFPPFDRDGRPGFVRICGEIARIWRDDRARAEEAAASAIGHLRAAAAPRAGAEFDPRAFTGFVDTCRDLHDGRHGGFGGAPKFPRPVVLRCLLQLAAGRFAGQDDATRCRDMAMTTLRAMLDGGIHDHLGGGFHRYSVDRRWHVPHYEKMLYDQALVADACLDAWQVTGDPAMRAAVAGTLGYAIRDLRDPSGGFHAAEDADSIEREGDAEKREGAYWTWRAAELAEVLDPREAAWFALAYGVGEAGNAAADSDPHGELAGRNTLRRVQSDADLAARFGVTAGEVAELLAAARAKLLAARTRRPRPHRDDKIVAAWNGLMLGALARAARVLERPDFADAARALADFLRRELWDGGRLARSWRAGKAGVDGFASDYAAVIHGFLEWHALEGEAAADFAADLQEAMETNCRVPGRSGYVMCARAGDTPLCEIEEDHDGAEPAANHLAAGNLLRLAALRGHDRWSRRADELLAGIASSVLSHPFAAPVALAAFDSRERGILRVEIHGEPDPALAAAIAASLLPGAVWIRRPGPGEVRLCRANSCLPPVRSAAEWHDTLAQWT